VPGTIDIQPPLGGVNSRYGFQAQPPYTTPRALNVWPRDLLEGRMRGGSRPGLAKAFPAGVTGPVHLLANVRVIEGTAASTQTQFLRDFNTPSFGSEFTDASWKSGSGNSQMQLLDGYAFVTASIVPEIALPDGGKVLVDLQQSTSLVYTLTVSILPDWSPDVNLGSPTGVYSLFARMDNTSPLVTLNGVLVEADFSSSPPLLRMTSYNGGVATVYTAISGNSFSGAVSLVLDVTGDVCQASSNGATITRTLVNAAFGRRAGFGIAVTQRPSQNRRYRLDYFRVDYTGSAPSADRNVIVAAGGTNAGASTTVDLRFEDNPNALVTPTTHAIPNAAARQLQAVELLGKLYVVGEDASWSFNPSGAGILSGLSITDVSTGCIAIAAWRTRLCVVPRADQQNIYMSKAGSDPPTWVYAALPVGSAIKLNTSGIDTGALAEPINALIAHSNDYLLVGLLNSLHLLRGDPTYGGQLDRLSSSIGIVAPQAWARGPNGETVILSQDGLYGIPAEIGFPQSVSREVLPQELRDVDVKQNRILMAYDVRNRGVFIGITPIIGSGGKYFWLDWEGRGFWPMEFNPSHETTALCYRNADASTDQRILLGCRDGHIRTFNDAAFNDDGVPFKTELLLGPIALGGTGYDEGMVVEIIGELGDGSATIQGELWVGRSAENAYKNPRKFAFPLRAGKNRTYNPQLSGNACFVMLRGDSPWATEKLCMVRERLGKQLL